MSNFIFETRLANVTPEEMVTASNQENLNDLLDDAMNFSEHRNEWAIKYNNKVYHADTSADIYFMFEQFTSDKEIT
jgi:hypothetical protein